MKEYNPVFKKKIKESSPTEYSSLERNLVEILYAIWENRRFIDKNDLDNLKFFENKGI
ncbi:MAG: hypothetical protein H8E98_04535 [Bacteroidetes bacterium]|nr:hypothetical protein [Bacteroidota bacterium]